MEIFIGVYEGMKILKDEDIKQLLKDKNVAPMVGLLALKKQAEEPEPPDADERQAQALEDLTQVVSKTLSTIMLERDNHGGLKALAGLVQDNQDQVCKLIRHITDTLTPEKQWRKLKITPVRNKYNNLIDHMNVEIID